MRNLLAFLAAMLVALGCVGWYLDWFKFEPAPSTAPGQKSYKLDVNTEKIGEDIHKGEQKIQGAINGAKQDEKKTDTKDKSPSADSKKQ